MARGGFRPGAGRKKGSGKKAEVKSLPLLAKAEEIAAFYAGLMEKARSGQKITPDDRKQLNALLQDMTLIHGGGDVAPVTEADETKDAKEYLEKLLVSSAIDKKTKIQVANILLPFQHPGSERAKARKRTRKTGLKGQRRASLPPGNRR